VGKSRIPSRIYKSNLDQECKEDRRLTKFYLTRKYYERDSAYLSLLDCFIQDGPQLILQIYIVASRGEYAMGDRTVGTRERWI
jgi:hypothetical protein